MCVSCVNSKSIQLFCLSSSDLPIIGPVQNNIFAMDFVISGYANGCLCCGGIHLPAVISCGGNTEELSSAAAAGRRGGMEEEGVRQVTGQIRGLLPM